MWLHHRDLNVSGKLRCPGKSADDDVMLALPSDSLSGIHFPTSGNDVGKSLNPTSKAQRRAGIPFERFQFIHDGELTG